MKAALIMTAVFFYRILCGLCLGISIFAPGFSGSIVAIAMGIYTDILRILSNPFKPLKQNITFCIPFAIGILISSVLFLITFRYLFDTYEKATYLLFVGLIAGNLPVIASEIKRCGFRKRYLIGGICAFAAAIAFGFYAIKVEPIPGVEELTVNWPVTALGGFVGGITALIPGMSVSVVLIIMGIYNHLLHMAESILRLNFTYLIPFGLFCVCAVVGLASASRGIKYIFKKYPGFSYATVIGFMSGSLISVLIQSLQIDDPGFSWPLGIVMLTAGLGVSMLFVILGKKINKSGPE